MIEFFSNQLVSLWRELTPLLLALLWPAVFVAALLMGGKLWGAKVDRECGTHHSESILRWTSSALKFAGLLAVVGIFSAVHRVGLRSVSDYQTHRLANRFDSQEVVAGTAVNLEIPRVFLRVPVERQTTVSVPGGMTDYVSFLKDMGYSEPQVISAVPQTNGTTLVHVKLVDYREQEVTLDDIALGLDVQPAMDADQRANSFALQYKGTFKWHNATDKAASLRFELELPDNGGTLTGLEAKLDNKPIVSSDTYGAVNGVGSLEAGASSTATVNFSIKGRGNLRVNPAHDLRMVSNVDVKLNSASTIRFERGSLMPSSQSGNQYDWKLQNAITRQMISVAIPFARGTSEQWWKLGYMVPFALFGFVILLTATSNFGFGRLIAATMTQFVALSMPLAFPSGNLPPAALGFIGSVIAVGATYRILGKAALGPSVLSAALWLTAVAGPLTTASVITVVILSAFYATSGMQTSEPRSSPS